MNELDRSACLCAGVRLNPNSDTPIGAVKHAMKGASREDEHAQRHPTEITNRVFKCRLVCRRVISVDILEERLLITVAIRARDILPLFAVWVPVK